jgi:TrmH family RNA methyltransferase
VPARRIDSTANPLVKELASLKDRAGRNASGTFLVEGARETGRALRASVPVVRAIYSPELVSVEEDAHQLVTAAAAGGADVVELSGAAFSKISMRQNPDGVALQVAIVPRQGGAFAGVELHEGALVLVLDGIEKPGNLGALLRTADATGVDLVIVTGAGTDMYNPNVIRASQGSVFAVAPVAAEDGEALTFLRAGGARLVATTPASSTPHWAADLRGTVALLVGAEATGLRDGWLESADELVRVPMKGSSADSLNASVAGAVVLYEALRQRSA